MQPHERSQMVASMSVLFEELLLTIYLAYHCIQPQHFKGMFILYVECMGIDFSKPNPIEFVDMAFFVVVFIHR